jgi:ABC-2 type transport system ATP-binding protein
VLMHMERKRVAPAIDLSLQRVDLKRAAKLQIRKYSKGMVQRLGIAQAILHDPELVILDEPMSGLDPIGRRDIKDLIVELRKGGRTVFFSTHIISDVEEICDDVAMVVGGKIVRQGAVPELLGSGERDFEVLGTDAQGNPTSAIVNDQAALKQALEKIWSDGGKLTLVRVRKYGLEDIFMEEVRKAPVRVLVEGG